MRVPVSLTDFCLKVGRYQIYNVDLFSMMKKKNTVPVIENGLEVGSARVGKNLVHLTLEKTGIVMQTRHLSDLMAGKTFGGFYAQELPAGVQV